MPKITDPDDLNQGVEVDFLTGAEGTGSIRLNVAGLLTASAGVTGQAVYSFCKEEWRADNNLIRFPFPLISITEEKFDLIDGWNWDDTTTRELIKDAGWSVRDSANISLEEWVGIVTLGNFADDVNDTAYYQQEEFLLPTEFVLSGPVNQAIQTYNSGVFDRRSFLQIFLREQGKTYDKAALIDQNIASLDYKVFKFPLSAETDLNVTASDAGIAVDPPYDEMSIHYITGSGYGPWTDSTVYPLHAVVEDVGNWYQTALGGTSSGTGVGDDVGVTDWTAYDGERTIGATNVAFNIIVSGNLGTKQQIYEFVQYRLRQSFNIDDRLEFSDLNHPHTGSTSDVLANFVGAQLITTDGVYIDDFLSTDTNELTFTDVSGNTHNFPFVAAGTLNFNINLQNDTDAVYFMFFSGTPGGNFGTQDAVLVEDNSAAIISGNVNGSASIIFDFDYDNNVQGGRTAAEDADIIVVTIGLETGQYAQGESTIQRISNNSVTVVSSLERNYLNV